MKTDYCTHELFIFLWVWFALIEDKYSNCYNRLKQKRMDWIDNLLENNHITGLTFEGVNPVTEIWQRANDIRERGSLTLSNNQYLY